MEVLFAGDWRFFWPENIGFFSRIPSAWDASLNTGIGIPAINTLWINSYLNLTTSLYHVGFSWNTISLLFWIIPFVSIAFFSSFFLFRSVITKNNLFALLAGIIYTTNTYFLSIFLGGQIGVCFAYAFIPLILLSFINLLKNQNFYASTVFALVFSFELLFDPRFALLTIGILALYYLVRFKFQMRELLSIAIIPGVIVFFLHAFWLLPLLIFKSTFVPQGFNAEGSVSFFSFALLENSLSLLHPNWPENMFGKVYFMRPEFLLLPILAFSSLFFINSKLKTHPFGKLRVRKSKLQVKNQTFYNNETIQQLNNRTVLFFALLGLVGAFLAKGTNDPLGNVFLWLFESIPGFGFFRDPTKFYVLVALAYAVLIPFSLSEFATILKSKIKNQKSKVQVKIQKYLPQIIFLSFLAFWLFSLRLLFTTDTLRTRSVPQSYVQLKDFILSQDQFFRTLWIPQWQRYGYFSDINPAIGRGELVQQASASAMIQIVIQENKHELLQERGVKYLIIPEDSEGEFFLNDRKYDDKQYQQAISAMEKIPWLEKVKTFGKIAVFELSDPRDRFWSLGDVQIEYKFIKPTEYTLSVNNAKKGDVIVFSESFDPYWIATVKGTPTSPKLRGASESIKSIKSKNGLNSFVLPKDGTYSLDVYYQPQKWVYFGLMISGVTLILVIIYLLKKRRNA